VKKKVPFSSWKTTQGRVSAGKVPNMGKTQQDMGEGRGNNLSNWGWGVKTNTFTPAPPQTAIAERKAKAVPKVWKRKRSREKLYPGCMDSHGRTDSLGGKTDWGIC